MDQSSENMEDEPSTMRVRLALDITWINHGRLCRIFRQHLGENYEKNIITLTGEEEITKFTDCIMDSPKPAAIAKSIENQLNIPNDITSADEPDDNDTLMGKLHSTLLSIAGVNQIMEVEMLEISGPDKNKIDRLPSLDCEANYWYVEETTRMKNARNNLIKIFTQTELKLFDSLEIYTGRVLTLLSRLKTEYIKIDPAQRAGLKLSIVKQKYLYDSCTMTIAFFVARAKAMENIWEYSSDHSPAAWPYHLASKSCSSCGKRSHNKSTTIENPLCIEEMTSWLVKCEFFDLNHKNYFRYFTYPHLPIPAEEEQGYLDRFRSAKHSYLDSDSGMQMKARLHYLQERPDIIARSFFLYAKNKQIIHIADDLHIIWLGALDPAFHTISACVANKEPLCTFTSLAIEMHLEEGEIDVCMTGMTDTYLKHAREQSSDRAKIIEQQHFYPPHKDITCSTYYYTNSTYNRFCYKPRDKIPVPMSEYTSYASYALENQ